MDKHVGPCNVYIMYIDSDDSTDRLAIDFFDDFDLLRVVGEAVAAREERGCVQSLETVLSDVPTTGVRPRPQNLVNMLQSSVTHTHRPTKY